MSNGSPVEKLKKVTVEFFSRRLERPPCREREGNVDMAPKPCSVIGRLSRPQGCVEVGMALRTAIWPFDDTLVQVDRVGQFREGPAGNCTAIADRRRADLHFRHLNAGSQQTPDDIRRTVAEDSGMASINADAEELVTHPQDVLRVAALPVRPLGKIMLKKLDHVTGTFPEAIRLGFNGKPNAAAGVEVYTVQLLDGRHQSGENGLLV